MFKSSLILIVCLLFSSIANSWNVFPFFSNVSLHKFTKDKLSSLKNLRNVLHGAVLTDETTTTSADFTPSEIVVPDESLSNKTSTNGTEIVEEPLVNSNNTGTKGEGTSVKQPREGLFDKILPNRDILKRLVEMRDKVEPEVKRYLTDKYNLLLNNLIPYSDTIGVPPYVLNSMKIPQNFDPRLQALKTLIEFSIDHRILNKSRNVDLESKSSAAGVQSRSSDDPDFVSDQEPDATMKGQKKYQHVYISPRNRPRKSPFMIPERTYEADGYETSGTQRQDLYDAYSRDYYLEAESPYSGLYDMHAAAGSHVARGSHGHYGGGGGGYGGGHGGGGYGGMTDPFTILGSLAFLTYLGLLIQQSLNRTGGAGRRHFSGGREWETLTDMRRIPVILTELKFNQLSHLPKSQGSPVIANGDENSVKTSSRVDIPTVTSQKCNFLCQILHKTFSNNVTAQKNKKSR